VKPARQGLPPYTPIGPEVDRCIVFSIARTESGFDQQDRSAANAVMLMQVTPEARLFKTRDADASQRRYIPLGTKDIVAVRSPFGTAQRHARNLG
jgi:soluble lytic murein transglycosylase-like protein